MRRILILIFLCASALGVLAQTSPNDLISNYYNDSLNVVLTLNTRKYLIKQGYKPLSCQEINSANHFWKKYENGFYSNAHQIENTPYFLESTNQSNIVANKISTTDSRKFSNFPKTRMDSIDVNKDFIITHSEVMEYIRLLNK